MKRIAIVDDEELLAEIYADLFRDDFDVEAFTNPVFALERIPAFKPDLVLLDWRMPGLRGPELAARLASRGVRASVLFITADQDVEPKDYSGTPGCKGLVLKPFDHMDLKKLVAKILS